MGLERKEYNDSKCFLFAFIYFLLFFFVHFLFAFHGSAKPRWTFTRTYAIILFPRFAAMHVASGIHVTAFARYGVCETDGIAEITITSCCRMVSVEYKLPRSPKPRKTVDSHALGYPRISLLPREKIVSGNYWVVGVDLEEYDVKSPDKYMRGLLEDRTNQGQVRAFRSYFSIVASPPVNFENFTKVINKYRRKPPFNFSNPLAIVGGVVQVTGNIKISILNLSQLNRRVCCRSLEIFSK